MTWNDLLGLHGFRARILDHSIHLECVMNLNGDRQLVIAYCLN